MIQIHDRAQLYLNTHVHKNVVVAINLDADRGRVAVVLVRPVVLADPGIGNHDLVARHNVNAKLRKAGDEDGRAQRRTHDVSDVHAARGHVCAVQQNVRDADKLIAGPLVVGVAANERKCMGKACNKRVERGDTQGTWNEETAVTLREEAGVQ